MPIELLLSHADTHQPVLCSGLDGEALRDVPAPTGIDPSKYLRSDVERLDDLPAQRWGLVVPEEPEGQRLLELIKPLRALRQREQGDHPVRTYSVSRGMDREAAHQWKHKTFGSEQVAEEDRPRYLLILGDLDLVSLELQQVLSTDSLVGRLAFPSDEGYRAYVEKVLRWEERPSPAKRGHLLYYTARDGSSATLQGHGLLMEPCFQASRRRQQEGRQRAHPPVSLVETGEGSGTAVERFLRFASGAEPSVLLSLSHGLGRPQGREWTSADEQRALQGALLLARGQRLTEAEVASRPFLPGGIWFGLACFSAGTPAQSAYTPWLRALPASMYPAGADHAASLLPAPGERPFVAALPQAALANPEGPLAVVGHMDLAWTLGFSDQGQSRHDRFHHVVEMLGHRFRAGAALSPLLRAANEVGLWLSSRFHDARVAQDAKRRSQTSPTDWAFQWLQYHDLSSYVLLGDPAVRLPLAEDPSSLLGSARMRK
ncbi:hypothetical protein [Myxococcus sp. CA040A]|uniref:hypothetical protein n=1 Tax=Myxococcus sp. CA040A TaxID=2741738 RepID=UPI00157B15E7|nr:hypothetical protein [Myxococcus sp. CA040A]NTX07574.1 hypothetical protein [Myxococcus sp. CA040A]